MPEERSHSSVIPGASSTSPGMEPSSPTIFSRTYHQIIEPEYPNLPFLTFTIGPGQLERLVVRIWSHEDGPNLPSTNPYANSHTGFSFGLLQDTSTTNTPDDNELHEFQRNMSRTSIIQCHTNEWVLGIPCEGNDEDSEIYGWIESLASSSRLEIGVFPFAEHYEDVRNTVFKMEVEVHSKDRIANTDCQVDNIEEMARWHKITARVLDPMEGTRLLFQSVYAAHKDEPDVGSLLLILTERMRLRTEHDNSIGAFDRAVEFIDMAVNVTPEHSPYRASFLNNLGNRLHERFQRTGSAEDLHRAIRVLSEALDITPEDDEDRASRLLNLGSYLGVRFEHIGSVSDLTLAITTTEEALNITPGEDPIRYKILTNLGTWFGMRFERTASKGDLHRAIETLDIAADIAPHDVPDRALCLTNLANQLKERFRLDSSFKDIERAIKFADAAVEATPEGHENHQVRLASLGNSLGWKFAATRNKEDIDRGIAVMRMAVDKTPKDHPERGVRLANLGGLLNARQEVLKLTGDIEDQLLVFTEAWRCHNLRPSFRVVLAKVAAELLATQSRWHEAALILEDAIKLLPTISPRQMQQADKQHMLTKSTGLAPAAAAVALNAGKGPEHALQLLELGRGVIASFLLETRSEINELKQSHPNLATDFESLRDELDSPPSESSLTAGESRRPWEARERQRRDTEKRFNDIISEIRTQPGFQNFLLPPTAEDLKAAAASGPIVVVNASEYRCDAFLVQTHSIRLLPLPLLRSEDIKAGARVSLELLESLWLSTACPILDELNLTHTPDSKWPRVWWVLTGSLSQIPLHAAGSHTGYSSETVLDRVVSSYSTSIKALLYSRHNAKQKVRATATKHLLVSMPTTPSSHGTTIHVGDLAFAEEEIGLLDSLLPPSDSRVVLTQPQKEDILGHMETCTVFHFAGHGISDAKDPSKSCLLLEDWIANPLTVEDLTALKLFRKSPWLAYLSACSTGQNQGSLQDEGIHLVSACQLAGFSHVVGSLWEVSDEHSAMAAAEVYRTIQEMGWSDESVAMGVHNAARLLRRMTGRGRWYVGRGNVAPGETGGESGEGGDTAALVKDREEEPEVGRAIGYATREGGDPFQWAAYVHIGC